VARGWACAMPSYTLAPKARISAMTQEIARAIEVAASLAPSPVVVTGHSAGGHLSARMGCADVTLSAPVKRVVPISPLADLEPLSLTAMNTDLRLDAVEIAQESPALLPLRHGVEAHVWVGAQERPTFLWQARLLSEAWSCPWTPESGRHHFDVIDGLTDPASALLAVCLG
jgi:arylformamidase